MAVANEELDERCGNPNDKSQSQEPITSDCVLRTSAATWFVVVVAHFKPTSSHPMVKPVERHSVRQDFARRRATLGGQRSSSLVAPRSFLR